MPIEQVSPELMDWGRRDVAANPISITPDLKIEIEAVAALPD